jgi:SAM-dependent methyltransferase
MTDLANAEAIDAWNGVLFEKFNRFRTLVTDGLGIHGLAAVRCLAPKTGARVLDIGCGFGDTTLELARRVGSDGHAVGVDAAARFVDEARKDAREAGADNVEFFVGDVQEVDLGGPYDCIYSRFGTMFFLSPMRAMKNVHAHLAPGGCFAMVVWRKREDNVWLHAAETCVREIIPEEEEIVDEPTCGPGPFSMAGADFVSDVMMHAGFERVCFQRHDADICIGKNLSDAVEFAMALGPAGEIVRLAGENGEKKRHLVEAALRDALAPFVRPSGVFAGSSTWVVTAHKAEA